jgi:hypothetical protein
VDNVDFSKAKKALRYLCSVHAAMYKCQCIWKSISIRYIKPPSTNLYSLERSLFQGTCLDSVTANWRDSVQYAISQEPDADGSC